MYGWLPYEDESRSAEGPGAGRRGPEGTALNPFVLLTRPFLMLLERNIVQVFVRWAPEADRPLTKRVAEDVSDQFLTPIQDFLEGQPILPTEPLT